MIARCGAGSWSMRAAMSARSEPGSVDAEPHVAASAGQLDEEQRVAAAAVDELGDRRARRLVAVAAFEDPAHELGRVVDAERTERHLQHERPLDGRRPHQVAVGALRR